jgi:hypothetical protein
MASIFGLKPMSDADRSTARKLCSGDDLAADEQARDPDGRFAGGSGSSKPGAPTKEQARPGYERAYADLKATSESHSKVAKSAAEHRRAAGSHGLAAHVGESEGIIGRGEVDAHNAKFDEHMGHARKADEEAYGKAKKHAEGLAASAKTPAEHRTAAEAHGLAAHIGESGDVIDRSQVDAHNERFDHHMAHAGG